MAHECILAIDQGTTNTKALLFDRDATSVFRTSASVLLLQPRPGFVEQDPIALWKSVCEVMRESAAFARENNFRIAGIAISNQRETAVAWKRGTGTGDAVGAPVHNAISWQCRRSESICKDLRNDAETLQNRTGLPLDPLLSATKWAWLLKAMPELHAQAKSGELLFGTVDAWLIYNLTSGKVHATDLTNASRVALLNLQTLHWDEELLALFDISRNALPELVPSSGHIGECTALPELAGVPVVAMIGDSHAALVGHGCYASGAVKSTYGTGSSLMMLTPGLIAPQAKLARTIAWALPDSVQFALEGNIAMSGAAVQWVGEFLGLPNPAEDAAALAETIADAAGLILVPAMLGLGAPYWDSAARGLMTNIERSHTATHLARAAVDAIAMQVADVLEAMEQAAGVKLPILLADGGATRNRTLMQFQADVLDSTVQRSMQEELSARGAALLGGLALGWWKNLDEAATLPNESELFTAKMDKAQRQKLREQWKTAVARARLHPQTEGSTES